MWALLLLLALYAVSKARAQAQPQTGTQIVTGIPATASGAKMPLPQEAINQAIGHALQNLYGAPVPRQGAGPLIPAGVPAGSTAAGTGSGVTTTTGTTQTGTATTGGYIGSGNRTLLL